MSLVPLEVPRLSPTGLRRRSAKDFRFAGFPHGQQQHGRDAQATGAIDDRQASSHLTRRYVDVSP
jgi:hypothetical protein